MAGNGGRRPGGGRKKGRPNKATIERAIIAQQILERTEMSGRKFGKEVLEELMVRFSELACKFQPDSFDTAVVQDWAKTKNYDRFVQLAALARDTARELAKYQSPTFKAVEVSAPAPAVEASDGKKVTRFQLHIFDEDLRTKNIEHHPKEKPD
jgi:hypothetical protein